MFNIGSGELALIAVVALLILGPKRLPELARGIGKFVREFRRQTDEVRGVVEREFYKMDQELSVHEPPPTLGSHEAGPQLAPAEGAVALDQPAPHAGELPPGEPNPHGGDLAPGEPAPHGGDLPPADDIQSQVMKGMPTTAPVAPPVAPPPVAVADPPAGEKS